MGNKFVLSMESKTVLNWLIVIAYHAAKQWTGSRRIYNVILAMAKSVEEDESQVKWNAIDALVLKGQRKDHP